MQPACKLIRNTAESFAVFLFFYTFASKTGKYLHNMVSKYKYLSMLLGTALLFSFTACHHDHEHDADHDHDHHHSEEVEEHDDADEHEHAAGEIVFSEAQAEAAGLSVETVQPADFVQVLKVNGEILSAEGDEKTIVATASGIVDYANQIVLTEGLAVRGGQELFTLSATGMASGDAVAQAQGEREAASAAWERAQRLWQQRLITRADYEEAELRYKRSSAVQNAHIVSPMNGYLKRCFVTAGTYVTEGQPLAVITRNCRLQLHADVSARYYSRLQGLSSADIVMPYDEKVYHLNQLNGRLLSIGKASGLNTSSADYHGSTSTMASPYIPVIFEFDAAPGLFAGSFADVYLISGTRPDVLSVPLSALIEEQGLFFVFVQIDDDGYRKQEVTLGQRSSERAEVLAGLQPGDAVVVKGAYQIKLASVVSVAEGHHHH